MCGRLTLKTAPDQWAQLLLPAIDFERLGYDWQPRYNIAPTQDVVVIANLTGSSGAAGSGAGGSGAGDSGVGEGSRAGPQFALFRWGLVPSWSADLAIGSRMINARYETLREKKSFSGPLRQRRCLIVADGYYEWQQLDPKHKQPHWISPTDGGVMQLAGLWETNTRATGRPISTCTIITTAANARLAAIHNRMPIVLSGAAAERWMDAEYDAEQAYAELSPAPDDFLAPRPVSSHVNNPRHEDEQCLAMI